MKKLVKVRIINWHYFFNTSFDLDQVNFLTGQNAAGKSTLIDAMQVVLLGDTSGKQFNKAANEKSGRTLKGYLKGELGDDGEGSYKYLRTGRFSSYIALEWEDDLTNSSFVTGIVFDMYEDSSESHHFFTLNDKIPQNDFILVDTPMSYKQLSDYFENNYKKEDYWFSETNAQYQERIKDIFGGIKNKYFTLFKKAVSFNPITNIEQFLTEYVCDVPSEINIDSMRNNIRQYKRLEIEAENMQAKINRLEEIQRLYNEFTLKKQELNLANYITKKVTYQLALNSIASFQSNIATSESRISEIISQIAIIDEQLISLNKEKETYIAQKVSLDSFQLNNELMNAKKATDKKIKDIEENLNLIKENSKSYINNYRNASNNLIPLISSLKETKIYSRYKNEIDKIYDTSINMANRATEFEKSLSNENLVSKNALIEFKNAINQFKEEVFESSHSLKSELADLVTKHANNKQQVLVMEQGGKSYDSQLILIRNELKHKLSDYFGEDVQVYIYADLVDIKDAKWVKAIEGFISAQKLNLFVDNKYYDVANKFLPDIMRRVSYYRTGLVDSEKLHKAHFNAENNSLAEEIITDHVGARDYTNFLIGRMKKCSSIAEAREYGIGITPNAEGYRNFASFVIPERNYLYPLIGRKASADLIRVKKLEVEQNEGLITIFRTLINQLNDVIKIDSINQNEFDQVSTIIEDGELLPSLKSTLSRYEGELENSDSLELSTIEKKINRIEEDIESLEKDKNDLISEKGGITVSIKNIQDEKIPSLIENSNILLSEIKESFDEEFINTIGLVRFNEELEKGKSLVEIRSEYEEIYTRLQNRIRNQFNSMNELRREYVVYYKLSYDTTKESNEDFDNELVLLRDVKLPEYQEKILDAYNKATKEFKDDFIYKLKTSIETVRTQIDDLNEALKDAQFGQDSYQFVALPNPLYREYYDMITDNLVLTSGGNEDEYLEKYKEVMNNLFRQMGDLNSSSDQNSLLEQNVQKFTDFRTYLTFDMLVKKGDEKPYSLAKNIKKQSGGETQTPFYVSMLASFSQLYRIRQGGSMGNCIRLVIFDEAFSKMDSTRIIESIKILKNFGLQVILSAPSEKIADLSKIVDKTLLVNRIKQRSYVDPFVIKKVN